LDLTDTVKLDKGCYLGQELCARTFYTGIIRKRLYTFFVSKNKEELEYCTPKKIMQYLLAQLDENRTSSDKNENQDLIGKFVKDKKGKKVFEILNVKGNIGIGIGTYMDK